MADVTRRRLDLNNWREAYKKKLVSAEEAARSIKSGDTIIIPNVYLGLMPESIIARREELRDVTVEICTPLSDPGWLSPGMEDSFNVIIRIFLTAARQAHDEGRVPFLPYTNGTWIKPYRDKRSTRREIDVFIVEVSPPDEHGFCYFGQGVWESGYFSRQARTVIAEVDEYLVRLRGDAGIHVSEIDYLVDITEPPFTEEEIEKVAGRMPEAKRELARTRVSRMHPRILRKVIPVIQDVPRDVLEHVCNLDDPTDTMIAMAANLKTILKDRDTIQIGTGKHTKHLVNLGTFDHLNDLSIFSELGCPGLGFLVKRGIATGKYASLHPGKAVFSSLSGMLPEEVRWIEDNPLFELYPGDYVINIPHIAQNANMVSVNNATSVDLTGQITCESQFGPRLINGVGGQVEFHIGAFLSPGGRAVTFLPSTWGDGSVSTIVPYFEKGTLVSLSRYWADYVITEWGVAELAGRTHRERAEELIRVAHPDFRDELREAAENIC
jgi:4-hydroxybutyrate CoA-transferase